MIKFDVMLWRLCVYIQKHTMSWKLLWWCFIPPNAIGSKLGIWFPLEPPTNFYSYLQEKATPLRFERQGIGMKLLATSHQAWILLQLCIPCSAIESIKNWSIISWRLLKLLQNQVWYSDIQYEWDHNQHGEGIMRWRILITSSLISITYLSWDQFILVLNRLQNLVQQTLTQSNNVQAIAYT